MKKSPSLQAKNRKVLWEGLVSGLRYRIVRKKFVDGTSALEYERKGIDAMGGDRWVEACDGSGAGREQILEEALLDVWGREK